MTAPDAGRWDEIKRRCRFVRADNDLLFDEAGKAYIDLFSAHGTTWLGHCNPRIREAVTRQLDRIWLSGGLETDARAEAVLGLEQFLPAPFRVAHLYSTGMEAAEFALRFARCTTRRQGAVGFRRCMHGKSLATASLGWDNPDDVHIPSFVRLPFVGERPEDEIMHELEAVLATGRISAVFIEPVQGCGGGHLASPRFCAEVRRLCTAHGVLLVFDELLTGCYRTGPRFFCSGMAGLPDVILLGKALGNGFPVSAVAIDRKFSVEPRMLPGSTFSSNPLAAAALSATLQEMTRLDVPGRVRDLEPLIRTALEPLSACGVAVRGRGALWILELPPRLDALDLVVRLFQRGVCVGVTGRQLRVLPAATIGENHLAEALSVLREEILVPHDER